LTGTEAEEMYARGNVGKLCVFEKYEGLHTAAALIRITDGMVAVLTTENSDRRCMVRSKRRDRRVYGLR